MKQAKQKNMHYMNFESFISKYSQQKKTEMKWNKK